MSEEHILSGEMTPAKKSTTNLSCYCMLCRKTYKKRDVHRHMLGMPHRQELEKIKGRDCRHWCNLCQVSLKGLTEYAEHISTQEHCDQLEKPFLTVKPLSVEGELGAKLLSVLRQRNKELTKTERMERLKVSKPTRKIAARLNPEKQEARRLQQKKAKQMKAQQKMEKRNARNAAEKRPLLDTFGPPSVGHVSQNKENGLFGGLRVCPPSTALVYSKALQCPKSDQLSDPFSPSRSTPMEPKNVGFTRDLMALSGGVTVAPGQVLSGRTSGSDPGVGRTADRIGTVDVTVMLRQVQRALGMRDPPGASSGNSLSPENALTKTQRAKPGEAAAPLPCRSADGQSSSSSVPSSQVGTVGSSGKKGPPRSPAPQRSTRVPKGSNSRLTEEGEESPVKQAKQKRPSSAGSLRKELHQEADRRKMEVVKGKPRFGIEQVNPSTNPEGLFEEEDWPLTMDQWGPDHAPAAPSTPSLPQAPPSREGARELPPGAQTLGPVSPSSASWDIRSPQAHVFVKTESVPERCGEGEDVEGGQLKTKRKTKRNVVSESGPRGKKQKIASNNENVRVDQLLAVSLREEELSGSLETLDSSLIQARNALQAAYAEVQHLLLLRQQVTTELGGLRARRIEILQGMQGAATVTVPMTTTQQHPQLLSMPSFGVSPPLSSPYLSRPPIYQLAPALSPALNVSAALNVSPAPQAPVTQLVKSEPMSHPASSFSPVPARLPVPIPPAAALQPAPAPPAVGPISHQGVAAGPAPSVSSGAKQPEGQPTGRRTESQKEPSKRAARRTAVSALEDQSSTASSSSSSDSEEDEAQHRAPLMGQEDERGGGDSDCFVEAVTVESQTESKMAVVAIDDSDVEEEETGASSSQTTRVPKDQLGQNTSHSQSNLETVKKNASSQSDNTVKEEPSWWSFEGHTGPVHDLQIHGGLLYTCSGDNTARAYCLATKKCQAVFEGHINKVNCLLVSSHLGPSTRLYTGSSDRSIRCYSLKSKKCLERISLPDRVLCLHIRWNILYVGLANGSVVSFQLKTHRQLDVFECHGPRGVSCLGTSQEGARRILLVGSYDSTISVRDAKSGLLLRSLEGHSKTVLCLKVVNDLVFSGSSDTSVHTHNIHTGQLIRIYKGHGHAVTALAVLGKVMVTACLDKLVRVYELQSHDRLQVYGGNDDMVMCMVIHSSVIYTGCYDGTVKAVKLNLMQNYRCWWHGCSLIFAVGEHLLQHLVRDHSHPQGNHFKCRWRNCNALYAAQDDRKDLPGHMQAHMQMDSKLRT